MGGVRRLQDQQRVGFAQQFKAARAIALRDAEAFEEHLFVMERLGSYITNSVADLKTYEKPLRELAEQSPLAFDAERKCAQLHVGFTALYQEARLARNDAMHQGAIARHLARHAQELALIMEDALMTAAAKAREFMVRDPVCAELWHPLSAVRRSMLLNAFSFLPFEASKGQWKLLADSDLVCFVRSSRAERKKRLLMTLEEALTEGLETTQADVCDMEEPIEKLAASMRNVPWLVVKESQLVGLITAFDIL